MGKDKLRRFAENLTFRCMIQPEFNDIFNGNHELKGRWAKDFFDNSAPIVLELGCGAGEYTVELARRYPEKNFIGVDIKGARMWRGAKTATNEGLKNVAFVRTRIEFINSFFGEGEVSEIWLTFSDPRLKATQSEKRLTSPRFLERYGKFLSSDGMIRLKTDSAHLHHYTRFVAQENSLEVVECNPDIYNSCCQSPELLTIQTAYEKRFVAEGLPITYFAFKLGGKREFSVGEFYGDREEGNLDERRVRRKIVDIDPRSGFCFGVVRAIEAAEDFLSKEGSGYCLGDIVHNKQEIARLENLGLKIVEHDELKDIKSGSTVIIRAHGEPPTTYDTLNNLGLKTIDATCPVVASLQNKVRSAWQEMKEVGGQVVLLGKRGHSEVIGLTGQCAKGEVLVVESLCDLDMIDYSHPITLLSQTTQSSELFEAVKAHLIRKCENRAELKIMGTICRHVAGRNSHLKEFARKYDVVLFVSGKNSSNGKSLFEICKQANENTYFVESTADVDMELVGRAARVGISGATSTPRWLMEHISAAIERK
ncbi:MAG: 4-hydroxy-3-methylbut-2-enyl diphosphate reductase [Rikenellaceae bacterium]